MGKDIKVSLIILLLWIGGLQGQAQQGRNIRDFNVLPKNDPEINSANLQKAIDWASPLGAALYVEPSDEPYALASGLILKKNVSIIGVHGPVPRGTSHISKKAPVGSVFKITDDKLPLFTVAIP